MLGEVAVAEALASEGGVATGVLDSRNLKGKNHSNGKTIFKDHHSYAVVFSSRFIVATPSYMWMQITLDLLTIWRNNSSQNTPSTFLVLLPFS